MIIKGFNIANQSPLGLVVVDGDGERELSSESSSKLFYGDQWCCVFIVDCVQ